MLAVVNCAKCPLRFAALHQRRGTIILCVKAESFEICVQRTATLIRRVNCQRQGKNENAVKCDCTRDGKRTQRLAAGELVAEAARSEAESEVAGSELPVFAGPP